MRLKRTFLAVTTVFSALLCLNGCGSDSGSSVLERDVKGLWSFYEPNYCEEIELGVFRGTCFSNPQLVAVPSSLLRSGTDGVTDQHSYTFTSQTADFTEDDVGQSITINGAGAAGDNLITTIDTFTDETSVELAVTASTSVNLATWTIGYGVNNALAYDGGRNKPEKSRTTKNFIIQLTNRDEVQSICDNCGQAVGGSRLFGKFIATNSRFLCTPDFNKAGKAIGSTSWLKLYATLDGTRIEGSVTGNINQNTCSRNENSVSAPGPGNCAPDASGTPVFPAVFEHPVEINVSGELQWELWTETPFGNYGFCKMKFTYTKEVLPNQLDPQIEAPTACNESGEFELYKSDYQSTNILSPTCGTPVPPSNTVVWSQSSNFGGCGDRDAYRWGPVLMLESDCLDKYVAE